MLVLFKQLTVDIKNEPNNNTASQKKNSSPTNHIIVKVGAK